ncbi:monocarboxylate transporter 5-like isoform X1 [Parasteatoda tepidariorum]|uniref:monocarboxylate transporter 5-like isoform X2 n=1 Tax=Parasteatoda tepidariorum TaxID=114398 RepID=UPI001C721256|nr:monocarboxylate transporter 5-like isoform X2 [Parasteatoda tepidariorum]XP_042901898.1 monocarboxylate transporter 5-like isoform X1 [Parasteatoda tepidariorum]
MRCWWENYRRHVFPKKMRSLLPAKKRPSIPYLQLKKEIKPPAETMTISEGPDQGHAWVIAFTASIITLILSGISKMVGILYVAVIDTYDVSREEATIPFTFRKSLRCLSGPIVGIMGQRFGIRTVTLVGAVVAATGAGLSFFAPTVGWLAVCWGGIHGTGEAFANTLFQVVVNQYFEKYRSTASGIALSGACVGSVFFSFLIEYLTEQYGLQGTFLILSGVILHVIPAAMLLRSPSWIRNGQKNPNERTSLKSKAQMYVIPEEYVKSNANKKLSIVSLNPNLLEKNKIREASNVPLKSHSATNLLVTLEKKLQNGGVDNLAFEIENENHEEKKLYVQNNLLSIAKENNSTSILDHQTSLKEDLNKENVVEKVAEKENKNSWLSSIRTIAKLYTNPIFLLICVCMCTYVLVFIPIMTSMVDYSQDKGLPETAGKYLIHTMALGDIIGRLCFGWVTDKNLMSMPNYMMLTLFLQGTFILCLPAASTLPEYLILVAFYSLTAGSMLVRMPVIILKNVKKEEQSIAMGCYGFASGLVPFGIPFLIGHFRDHYGSYDGMYYLLGGLTIASSSFWLVEPVLVRWKNSKIEESQNSINV